MEEKRNLTIGDRLRIVEEAKGLRNYDLVIRMAEEIRGAADASEEEKAYATLIEAEALACLEDLEGAEKLFRSIESEQSVAGRAMSGLGVLEAARGRLDDATARFHRALQIEEDNDIALAGLGLLSAQAGRDEEAWTWFQKALARNCENKRALASLIDLGYRLNRLADIESAISKYLDLHPVDLSLMYARAGCRYAQGKVEAAVGELEKIRVFEPNHALANELLSRIEEQKSTARTVQ